MSKIGNAIKANKLKLVLIVIVWALLIILFVSAISASITEATTASGFELMTFIEKVTQNVGHPFQSLGKGLFDVPYQDTFFSTLGIFTLLYIIVVSIALFKSMPKHDYQEIEHGSSDWSENGEQYQILNPKKGIILAEKNYLPIDKRGNTNVLVVGRIRFW